MKRSVSKLKKRHSPEGSTGNVKPFSDGQHIILNEETGQPWGSVKMFGGAFIEVEISSAGEEA